MHQFLVSVVAFVVLISIMVIVHELGHFIAAKLCGVRVERFSLGFPPRLFGIKIGETDYCVSATLAGGYVKMTGENPAESGDEEDPGSFAAHPRWQRILIGLAGPVANILLTLALMLFYYGFINEVTAVEVQTAAVEWVTPGSAAEQAGFAPGDAIQSFDGVANPGWDQVYERVKLNADQTVAVTVDRVGKTQPLSLHIPASAKNDDFELADAGILPQYLSGPIQVQEVQPSTPAAAAGLQAGDAITSVDGHPFHTVTTLLAYMQAGQGKPIQLEVLRNGATVRLTATPAKLDAGYKLGFVMVPVPIRNQPLKPGAAWKKSLAFCHDNSLMVVEVLDRLFTRRVSMTQLMGPVGIARVAGDAAEMRGWSPKFILAGEISLQLGLFNLLPFPILDGGMILFLLIESALRRDISLDVKERIYQAAFVVLMVFFVFVIFNDVSKLPLFTHVRP